MSAGFPTDKKTLLTPFNVVVGIILCLGLVVTILRFTKGLAAVTNLSDDNPWGIWAPLKMCFVAFGAAGYTTTAACYVFGLKRYHSAVRPAVLTALLAYTLVVISLAYDVGRPWRLPYPFFVQSGPTSVLFEVGLCVLLYLMTLFIEWLPACLEWLGIKAPRNAIVRMTLALTIFGVVLSTMHQSSFGGLYLISPSKLYPLWYSPFLPVYFFVSSIAAGFSMVILLDALSFRTLRGRMDNAYLKERDQVTMGFAKAAAIVLACYFFLKLVGITLDNDWHYLWTGWGMWFLLEFLGFAALPALLFAMGVRETNVKLIRWAALLCVLGIILNRFNVTLVAFNWQLPAAERYFPSFMEIALSIFQITLGILAFRFIVSLMPIYYEHPQFKKHVPLEYEEEGPRKFEEHPLKPHPQTFGH